MNRGKLAALFACFLFLTACGGGGEERYVGRQVGLDLPRAQEAESTDSHGGFHGDGLLLDKLVFTPADGEEIEEQIQKRGDLWNPGPFDDYLGGILYEGGPAAEGEWPRSPKTAYWFFHDRHEGEGALDQRGSWNYTAALYDAGTDTLYYLEFDT